MTKEAQDKISSPRLIIRKATAKDEPCVVALWRASNLVTSYNDPSKDFHFARAREGSDILVGLNEEQTIVGSVMVGHDGHRGWIYSVAVASAHRHHGIGSQLVARAEQALAGLGCVKINLQILEGNEGVAAFYTSCGYAVEKRVNMGKRIPENIPHA